MKGGKGGTGRKRSSTRVTEKPKPHTGPKRGAPKKDWGAGSRDDLEQQVKPEIPNKTSGTPSTAGAHHRRS